jgi:hypothetical protein
MRLRLMTMGGAATALYMLFTPYANAIPGGAAAAFKQSATEASNVEQVRRVCRMDRATNRRVCWVDRSRPPTVCHWVRDRNGNLVRDCY